VSSAVGVGETWTIQRVLDWSIGYLKEHASDSPRLDAELLLAHTLSCSRVQLYTGYDKPLGAAEREPFKQLLKRRAQGEPVAYLTGTKEFMGLTFHVDKHVLIPRPDTEVLVETALAHAKKATVRRILDIGTGSGCIAIALGKHLPDAAVVAWERDPEALAVARANAERLAAANVTLTSADALATEVWRTAGEPFDLIVSNPPYIALAERPTLPKSVVGFEPEAALFAAQDGLEFYAKFAATAADVLSPAGVVMVEIGSTQEAAVTKIFKDHGWHVDPIVRDYQKLPRVVVARLERHPEQNETRHPEQSEGSLQ
jgi:release factor glutamine methyltransferase